MKNWLTALIRAAVREEIGAQLDSISSNVALVETKFADIAVRVKEKQERKAVPQLTKQWGAQSRVLEMKSEDIG